jgi:hypothetical protein
MPRKTVFGVILAALMIILCMTQFAQSLGLAPQIDGRENAGISSFKPLGSDSIVMLIGDLPYTTLARVLLAKESGVDTVLVVFRTRVVESTFSILDEIVEYAAELGIAVIPRVIVDSSSFTEYVYTHDDRVPDYTNQTQLNLGMNLLREEVLHLESFPNIVAYQIEWGHYGESWINSPFWNSASSNSSFINYLRAKSPLFQEIDEKNFADWIMNGDIMYYSEHLPNDDPRRDEKNVALFYWYQEWRNSISLNITWAFRSLAKQLTQKPIIGFSYTGTNAISYVYSAHKYLDASFCDSTPTPAYVAYTANTNFIKDAYFTGLHLGELDFDSPYFLLSEAQEAIAGMYRKGIVPVIFYPQWSVRLRDRDIPVLVSFMKQYRDLARNPVKGELLLVRGRCDVGFWSLDSVAALAPVIAPCASVDPAGLMAMLEKYKLRYDTIGPEVYTPSIGDMYKIVVVFVPRDTLDCDFLKKLQETSSYVVIMHPSFVVGTPTATDPTHTASAIFGMWNPLTVKNRRISVAVTGTPPGVDITFSDRFSGLGGIGDYVANYLFSFYDGAFDKVYAMTNMGFPVVGEIRNLVFFGLDMHVQNETQRTEVESFFIELLRSLDYPQSIGITDVAASTAKTVVSQGYAIRFNTTLMNYGLEAETFNVTLYGNATDIETLQTSVGNGQAKVVTLEWKTAEMPLGAYEIRVTAETLENETDAADNLFAYGIVRVSIPGDINSDGRVNILDISMAAKAYGSQRGEQRFDSNVDMNEDGTINILDISAIAKEYGKST